MMRNHTGLRPWQLSGSTGQTVTWAAGGNGRFLLGDIPDVTDGNLCTHVLGVLLTIIVTIGASGMSTLGPDTHTFLSWLFDSVEVRNAWHGTPVSQNHAKGCLMGLMEFMACGYQYFGRRMSAPSFGDLAGRRIKVQTFIPLSYNMGEKGHHSAKPAVFYRNSELQLNFGPGSADAIGEGANTIASATMQASAILLPESEIHLGAGEQFIDYMSPVQAGSEVVKLDS